MGSSPIGCNLFCFLSSQWDLKTLLKGEQHFWFSLSNAECRSWGIKSLMSSEWEINRPCLQSSTHLFQVSNGMFTHSNFGRPKNSLFFPSFQVWESFFKNSLVNFLIYPSPWSSKHGKSKKYTHALYWAQAVGPSCCCSFFVYMGSTGGYSWLILVFQCILYSIVAWFLEFSHILRV